MLIEAKESDLSIIADLARSIWHDHYINIIGVEQVEYMLKKMYALDALKKQISEGQQFYLFKVAEHSDNLGFISISQTQESQWFINKFYVLTSEQNKGLGAIILQEILSTMLSKDSSKNLEIRLTVNRKNYTSINFYFKHGFKIERVADFDIGDGYFMNDFVMIKRVEN